MGWGWKVFPSQGCRERGDTEPGLESRRRRQAEAGACQGQESDQVKECSCVWGSWRWGSTLMTAAESHELWTKSPGPLIFHLDKQNRERPPCEWASQTTVWIPTLGRWISKLLGAGLKQAG